MDTLYGLTSQQVELLQHLLNAVRTGGLNYSPLGLSVPGGDSRAGRAPATPVVWRLIQCTGYTTPVALGARKYWGKLQKRKSVPPPDDNSAEFVIGSFFEKISDDVVMLVNTGETGTSTSERRMAADDYCWAYSFGEMTATGKYPIYYTHQAWICEIDYSTSLHNLRVAFRPNSSGSTFYNRVQFDACSTAARISGASSTGTGSSLQLEREVTAVSAGEGPGLVRTRRRLVGRVNERI